MTHNFKQNSPLKIRKKNSKIIELFNEKKSDLSEFHQKISKIQRFRHNIKSRLLMITYFLTKITYLIVALLQIFVMNSFLSTSKNQFYGQQVIQSILNGESDIRDQLDSRIFPRITGCDITTRELGTSHTYTVQCILSLNIFYERIYVFLWFWIFLVIVPFIVYDLIAWILRIFFFSHDYLYKFVKRRIKIFNNISTKNDKYLLKLFIEYYIGADGVFVLRLIERNSNAGVVSELLNKMWHDFRNKEFLDH